MLMRFKGFVVFGVSCAALVVGCASAHDNEGNGNGNSNQDSHPQQESPMDAARRIAAEPTREGRERLAEEFRRTAAAPGSSSSTSAQKASDSEPSLGRVSQGLLGGDIPCLEGINGCVDWSNGACQIYAYCIVNTCYGTYSCRCDNVAAGGWGSCGW
jgi:hypothetical protein